jgi:hypothetical protein
VFRSLSLVLAVAYLMMWFNQGLVKYY